MADSQIPAEAVGAFKHKLEAEALKAEAEARKADAEAENFAIESRLVQQSLDLGTFAFNREKRREAEESAGNRFNFVYMFTESVDSGTVQRCIDQLTIWDRNDPYCEIVIIFSSPGGAVIAGLALFDFIQGLRHSGHRIVTRALGMAASMAGILLQAGEERQMGKEAWVLIHEASFGAIGSMGQVEDTVEWVKKIQKRILHIFAERSTLSVGQIAARWKRKDWWLSSDECLKLGFVDKVV